MVDFLVTADGEVARQLFQYVLTFPPLEVGSFERGLAYSGLERALKKLSNADLKEMLDGVERILAHRRSR